MSTKIVVMMSYIIRLCNDPQLAEEVVQLQGLKRLVELCKCESARVASDGVLVACLAAVRKVIMIQNNGFDGHFYLTN